MVIKAWRKDAKRRWFEEAWAEGLKLALGRGKQSARRLKQAGDCDPKS